MFLEKAIDHSLVAAENGVLTVNENLDTVSTSVVPNRNFINLIDSDSEGAENAASNSQENLIVQKNIPATSETRDNVKPKKKDRIILESDDESDDDIELNNETVTPSDENIQNNVFPVVARSRMNKRTRIILESDDEDDGSIRSNTVDINDDSKRDRTESESETEKPKSKRTRIISSSDDE